MTWAWAAIAGVDPLPLTFAELRKACFAKCDFEWGQTAELMALIANRHRDPKRERPYRPTDFYRPKIPQKRPRRIADLGVLKAMFTRPA